MAIVQNVHSDSVERYFRQALSAVSRARLNGKYSQLTETMEDHAYWYVWKEREKFGHVNMYYGIYQSR